MSLLLAACSAAPSSSPAPASVIPSGPVALPSDRFLAVPCASPLPPGLVEGKSVRCGALTVPESRAPNASARTITLAVTIVLPPGRAEPDPIVHLIGGPGGSTLGYTEVLGADFGSALAARTAREVVVFDQRGTGRSKPFLACKEREALGACADRLAGEGVDLAAYNTEENAADVEDLRLALGYPAVNLYGQSYGTLLALTVMRMFPGGVRSVLLESTSSIAVDALLTSSPKALMLALQRVFEECKADAPCKAAYPDPARDLETLLAREQDPAPVVQALSILTQLAQGTSYVPLYLRSAVTADTAGLGVVQMAAAAYLEQQGRVERGFSEVMFTTMNCYDYASLWTAERDARVNGDAPPAFRAALGVDLPAQSARCAALPAGRASDAHRKAVTSGIPTLLLAGTADSNTPVEIADVVAMTLRSAQVLRVPGWGHVMLPFGWPCGRDIYAAFLAAPTARLAPACLDAQRTVFATK